MYNYKQHLVLILNHLYTLSKCFRFAPIFLKHTSSSLHINEGEGNVLRGNRQTATDSEGSSVWPSILGNLWLSAQLLRRLLRSTNIGAHLVFRHL